MHIKWAITIILISICLATTGCASTRNFDDSLNSIAKPLRFSTVRWEARVIRDEISLLFHKNRQADDTVKTVIQYFSLVDRIQALKSEIRAANNDEKADNAAVLSTELEKLEEERATLEDLVAVVISGQIKETLAAQGIYNPLISWHWHFPPLSFRLEKLPHELVVSPRDRIESIREITMRQDMALQQMEQIESEVDKLGVSSLVTELGGYGGTYPTIVLGEADLRFILDTAIHEWLHQYLAFTPLGFRYLLDVTDIARDYDIATINETVVGMISQEIGQMVYKQYYAGYESDDKPEQVKETGFDFNREMREIRRAVDAYLAQGQIEQAEQFMEQKRQYLATQGYHIRKLNQAYFAFHGTYADKPTSISPIGVELRTMRDRSISLKDFLDKVSKISSRQDLQNSVK